MTKRIIAGILSLLMLTCVGPLEGFAVNTDEITFSMIPSAAEEMENKELINEDSINSLNDSATVMIDDSVPLMPIPETTAIELNRSSLNRVSASKKGTVRKSAQKKGSDNPNTYTVLLLDVEAAHNMVNSNGDFLFTVGSPVENVRAAALKLIEQIRLTSGTTHVAIVTFSASVQVVQNFTADYGTMYNAISKISKGSVWANFTAAYRKADELLSAVTDDGADKNIVLFSQGFAYEGEHSTEGKYSISDCSWQRTDNKIHAYEYANVAYATAETLMSKYNLYSIGLYQSFEQVPDEGKSFLRFALNVAEDIQDSGFYNLTNIDDLEFSLAPDLFNLAVAIDPDLKSISVKAISSSGNHESAVGAEVTIYNGGDAVITKKTAYDGCVVFSKRELLNNGLTEESLNTCTVSAHYNIGDLILCSEEIKSNGEWAGANYSSCQELIVDEPRQYVSLTVAYAGSDVMLFSGKNRYDEICKVMDQYALDLAQMTNGHILLSHYYVLHAPDDASMYSKDKNGNVVNNCPYDILIFKDEYWPCANISGYYDDSKHIYLSFNHLNSATLCHESGHYLFGFWDEYCYGKMYYYDTNGDGIVCDFDDCGHAGDKKDPHLDIKNSGYWDHGYVSRPTGAPSNFGLMENQYGTLEMSNASSYSYLNGNTTVDKSNPDLYSMQYYMSGMSCEDNLMSNFEHAASAKGYKINYTLTRGRSQTANYWFAALSAANDEMLDDNIYEGIDYSHEFYSAEETTEQLAPISFEYSDSNLTINLPQNDDIRYYIKNIATQSITQISPTVFSISNSELENNCFSLAVITEKDNSIVKNTYDISAIIEEDTENIKIHNETDETIIIVVDSICKNEGDYTSVGKKYTLLSETDEFSGIMSQSLSEENVYNYDSLQWQKSTENGSVFLETTKSIEEYDIEHISSYIEGPGTYSLMVLPTTGEISPITNLRADISNTVYDNQIRLLFEDPNDNSYYYRIQYDTMNNYNGESYSYSQQFSANDNDIFINTVDGYDKYTIAFQVISSSGAISDTTTLNVDLLPKDSDNDGIPDYWLSIYEQLLDLDDIANTDSDGDGLDNLAEYQYGTNPLNPDTDGDNVYDKIELLKGLDPTNSMSDGETDDYIVAYGTPELEITDLTFSESDFLFSVKNDTDGKAMRTLIEVTIGDETLALWTVNIDEHSIIDFAIDRNLIGSYDGLTITVDGRRITRDSDYSNNTFVYSPATDIALSDIDVVKQTTVTMIAETTPIDSNDIFRWTIVEGNCVTVDPVTGLLKANRIGQAKVHVDSLQGLAAECIVSVVAFDGAEYSEFDSRLINDNTQVAITGYIGDDTDVIIPETIGGLPVTAIYGAAFTGCSFETISIHQGITTITDTAFGKNNNLSDIIVDADNESFVSDDGVLYTKDYSRLIKFPVARESASYTVNANTSIIGSYAFYGAGISNIEFGSNLTSINASAFECCNSLTEVAIPETVSEIEALAFANCENLNQVNYNAVSASFSESLFSVILRNSTVFANSPVQTLIIGKDVESIPGFIFAKMGSLENLSFIEGSKLKRIGNYAFMTNSKLDAVNLPEGMTAIDSYAFSGCSNITSLTLPTTLTTIGTYAFNSCGSISNITIHYNVTSIGNNAFNNCSSLKIICYNRTPAYNYAVSNNIPYEVIPVPATAVSGNDTTVIKGNTVELSYSIEPWYSSDSVSFDSSKTNIATIDGATLTAAKCGTTTITATADSGVNSSFKVNVIGIENAEPVDFDYTVSSDKTSITINDYTGDNSSAVIPDTIAGIPVKTISSSFAGPGLENLTIGKNVSTIYVNTFGSAKTLKNIYVDKDSATYADIDGVLTNAAKTSITRYPQGRSSINYTVPSSITTIAGYAFSNSKIQEIDFSNANITTITWYAFSGSSLKEVTIPASVTSLGSAAFGSCSNLKTVRYNAENATYSKFIFSSSNIFPSSVETLIIGDGVKRIPEKLFAGGSFTEIFIPLSVIEIDSDALGSIDILTVKAYANNAYAKEYAESKGYSLEIVTCGNCKFTNWTTIEDPSCTVAGVKKSFCDTCGAEKTESIVPVGHKYGSWTKFDDNQHQRICENDSSHVEKENHSWNNGTVTKAATCTETGIRTYTCTVCGAKRTETIKATGHNYGAWTLVKSPTCTNEGVEQRVCSNDNKHVETRPIAKTAHTDNDGDGYCDTCHTDLGSGGETHESNCVCGKYHTGPMAGFIKFFHKIIYFFKNLFGKN